MSGLFSYNMAERTLSMNCFFFIDRFIGSFLCEFYYLSKKSSENVPVPLYLIAGEHFFFVWQTTPHRYFLDWPKRTPSSLGNINKMCILYSSHS